MINSNLLSLSKMKANQKGRVAEILKGHFAHQKLTNLGIFKGRQITKLSSFALSGPVTLKVGRSVIALGHSIATKIVCEIND